MNINDLILILNKLPGLKVTGYQASDIFFSCDQPKTLTDLATKAKMAGWEVVIFPNPGKVIYYLHGQDLKKMIDSLSGPQIYTEYGTPDLSLVTIHQMTQELKKRENLTFAIVWTEENNVDNIALEGCGNPTKVIGLLARAMNLAIKHADNGLNFKQKE